MPPRDHGLARLLAWDRSQKASYRFDHIEGLKPPNAARVLCAFRERGRPRCFLTLGSERRDATLQA